jgi:hypothetical protein
MTTSAPAVIAAFGRIARPIMRKFMPAPSCIGAARTTIETMRIFGLQAVEFPVCYAFQVPARKYAQFSGFTAAERAVMKARSANWVDLAPPGSGWNGHLVVLVEDRWLIDPSIDQVDAPRFGVSVAAEAFVVDTVGKEWNPSESFEIQLGLILDSGDKAMLMYRSIDDRGYLETEAWQDEGLPLLAYAIAIGMGKTTGEPS